MRKRDLFSAAAGAVIASALAGGIAWAAIPGGGVINGCYQKNEGQLRVIDPASDTCRPSEVAIVWNEQGLKGDKGDKGEKGDTGAPGKDGRDGRDGRDGTSATVEPEAPGANCATGGVKITAANGVAYVCSPSQGIPDPGPD